MENKEITVDGVNVKDCKRRIGKNNYCRYYKRLCSENNYNCIWKKYLRKEQECEKAKQNAQDTYELYQALMESFNILQGEKIKLEQECEALGQAYLEINELLQEKTKECTNLKAEKDELNKCYKNNSALLDFEETNTTKLINKVMKLEKTLIEIKDIAKYDVYTTRTDLCLKLNWIKNKIRECEVKEQC